MTMGRPESETPAQRSREPSDEAPNHFDGFIAERYARELADDASELLPDGLIAVFADETIDYVNSRAALACGLTAQEMRGHQLREVLPFQDMHGRDWWSLSDPARALHITTGHREKMLILPNGKVVLVTARYLRHPDGRLFAILLGLRTAMERLRAERVMAEVITTVAHELRSPVASITGFTSSLLRHWDRVSEEDKQLMLETIKADAERVTRLVTELLDISRIDARSLPIRPQPVDVRTILTAQVARRVGIGEAAERFRVEVEAELPELWADPDRLEQVVTNLVDNALRHGAGEVCLRVVASSTDAGEPAVRLCVSDEGDGIPEANRELVFSRFWQGGSKAGTGIGLFLVRGIVEAHGGTVRVREAPSGGAELEVLLPTGAPDRPGGRLPLG
ncbi:MAG: ATP-binding protein [Dermatophilaceae bacterium]|nr:PAS domain-containing protein [Intrasporangiaceae bacterium]